jgi:chromate transporter
MSETRTPTPGELFWGFLQIGGLAFGGAVAWARQVLVDGRGWMTEREYAELLGLSQVLPGPNIGNFAVMYGRRCHGLMGSLAAVGGFFLLPLCVVLGLVVVWQEFGQNPWIGAFMKGVAAVGGFFLLPLCVVLGLVVVWQEFGQNPWIGAFMKGVAAAAAGMALGAALKSGFRLKPPPEQILAILVIAALAAFWRVPLPWIILIFAPICVGMSLRRAFVARAGV